MKYSKHVETSALPQSFIPASKILPEITVKAVILSILLAIILAAANAYLGLKVGLTVSASIPAAVISMSILRFFRSSNILENNIVQTAASAGEALAAGMIYTIPALIIMHYWQEFNYVQTMLIALIGGLLGSLFAVPLRRALVNEQNLSFPEGTATANVLKAGTKAGARIKDLMLGGLAGALISLMQTGFKVVADGFQNWFVVKDSFLVGYGLGFNPAIFAAGYIVGIRVAISVLVGIILGWLLGVPILTYLHGLPADSSDPNAIAAQLWQENNRYMGVGTMLVGGLAAVIGLLKPVHEGVLTAIRAVQTARQANAFAVRRTDKDLSIYTVGWLLLAISIILIGLFAYWTHLRVPMINPFSSWLMVLVGTAIVLSMGFLLSVICGYFAGLVGSSMNPLSGLSLIALICTSIIFALIIEYYFAPIHKAGAEKIAAAFVIVITAMVCSAGAISNDTIQDLKAGQLVGATPWKQQVMMFVGVAAAAIALPLILSLLFNAYGLGGIMPHANMNPSQMLMAPQAGLMSAIVQGIFNHQFQWKPVSIGMIIAIVGLFIDYFLKKRGKRLIVLAIGLGIYLPIETNMPIVLGGFLAYFVDTMLARSQAFLTTEHKAKAIKIGHQRGLLLACGLVAGSAIMGVLLAIPFAISGSSDILEILPAGFQPVAKFLGIVTLLLLCVWIYRVVCYGHKKF